jgi:hypothetical protein
MKLAKEPKEIDFVIKSEPWSEKDLADFSLLIKEIKNKRKKSTAKTKSQNQTNSGKSQNHL